jgi:hypothetical protein
LKGSVREQSLLGGDAIGLAAQDLSESTGQDLKIRVGHRSALAIREDETVRCYAASFNESRTADRVSEPAIYLVDPNEAIRAAGLTDSFALDHDLSTLGGAAGFLTSDQQPRDSGLAVIGRVIWKGGCDDRNLRRQLRARDVYPERIKVRGTDHDPATLAKRFRECGSQPVTLWIGRSGTKRFAALSVPIG